MNSFKICYRCKVEKSLDNFYLRKDTNKSRGECKKCWNRRNNEKYRNYHINYARNYRKKNREKYNKSSMDYRRNHPERALLVNAKNRAKRKRLEFNIDESDIVIPKVCPILGIEISINNNGKGPNPFSPSIDRINNDKGYIKGNVRVISFRANSLKKDSTIEEIEKILEDLKNTRNLRD